MKLFSLSLCQLAISSLLGGAQRFMDQFKTNLDGKVITFSFLIVFWRRDGGRRHLALCSAGRVLFVIGAIGLRQDNFAANPRGP